MTKQTNKILTSIFDDGKAAGYSESFTQGSIDEIYVDGGLEVKSASRALLSHLKAQPELRTPMWGQDGKDYDLVELKTAMISKFEAMLERELGSS